MSKITVYISTVSSNLELKKHQQKIECILGNNYKGCDIEYIDIATSVDLKQKMREVANDPKALPPQFAKGDKYLGDFNAFDNAVEDEDIAGFLQI
ncbi:SH3 domain-binding glutamic acid-rich-like protein 3 [Actinia tenebrosa]|uniref:SH3 domain-binding glutamic acid-rich-like protein 3 n=1 Tax=Actinia tenebrosa TaxID=6105 RepID=A0A6P8IQ09_ACTTE|nr:SH3 domain-binding glutamic acid-rich-like protein 3 [Actinia tenebrosa]